MTLVKNNLEIKSIYDVVVIGSGYGGSIAAARLSEKGYSVCLFEKGKEYKKGDFPDTSFKFLNSCQANIFPEGIKNRTALFDYKHFSDLDILSGCGLGGGSLINAGVLEKPSIEVLQSEEWPEEIKSDLDSLEKFYDIAKNVLNASVYPENKEGYLKVKKFNAFNLVASESNNNFKKVNLTINFDEATTNQFAVTQEACNGCGNCFTGCNFNAKNSLDKNYLAIANKNNAEIYTQIYVSHIQFLEEENSYLVYFTELVSGFENLTNISLKVVKAKKVVLGAGSIGSTEILFRSKIRANLKVSDYLGFSFSGNSGIISGGINLDTEINQVGISKNKLPERRIRTEERRSSASRTNDRRKQNKDLFKKLYNPFIEQVGPTITAMLDKRLNDKNNISGHVIEDSAVPATISTFFQTNWLFIFISRLLDKQISTSEINKLLSQLMNSRINPAKKHTMMFLGVGHDQHKGSLEFDPTSTHKFQEVNLIWPGYIEQNNFKELRKDTQYLIEKMGGNFFDYSEVLLRKPLTVHPLGGCRMSSDISLGVVNHMCQVYKQEDINKKIYEGLYIVDASIIPRSLGINPMWTISALAERAMSLVPENNLKLEKKENQNNKMNEIGIKFLEKFQGHWYNEFEKDYEYNSKRGEDIGIARELNFKIEVVISDLNEFIKTKSIFKISGELEAPALSLEGKLIISEGSHFQFQDDLDSSFVQYFTYDLQLYSIEGRKFILTGRKELLKMNYLNVWNETTTLFFDIQEVKENKLENIGKGIATISLENFLKNNIASLQTLNSNNFSENFQGKSLFLFNFLKQIIKFYSPGNLFRSREELIPAQDKPILRDSISESIQAKEYLLKTKDGLVLQMNHFKNKNSSKGSVLLLHGLTSSSEMFSMPEHKNLKDWLLEKGFDVWLYDFRISGKLPYNEIQHDYSFDHIALYDIPLAIDFIRNTIPANSKLHVICHCLGSVSFFHSLAAKLVKGVDSIISNSISLFSNLPMAALLKLELLINSRFLEDVLRIPQINPSALKTNDWLQSFISYGNSFFHRECDSATCHMLSFMWGTGESALFEHKNILDTTHNRLHELFGATSMNYYRHVAKIARAGKPIKFYEEDDRFNLMPNDYLSSISENKVPIFFITGKENKVFWDSNIKAYHYLMSANKGIHQLKVFSGYGHQDVFMGRNVQNDIFPTFIDFWNKI